VKYKPGKVFVVTRVPELAKPFVIEGMPAEVVPYETDRDAVAGRLYGLVMVKIGFFTYWWRENDLGLYQ
jgi:hypothetical protein